MTTKKEMKQEIKELQEHINHECIWRLHVDHYDPDGGSDYWWYPECMSKDISYGIDPTENDVDFCPSCGSKIYMDQDDRERVTLI